MNLDEFLALDERDPSTRLAGLLVEQDEALIDRLIELRREARLSQTEVATRLGITQSAIAKFEAGDRDPRLSTVRRYALAVGASIVHKVEPYKSDRSEGDVHSATFRAASDKGLMPQGPGAEGNPSAWKPIDHAKVLVAWMGARS